jgi:hypothetical protein
MKERFIKTIRGQIVVLLAVVLIALLGFTALAIDGAVIFSDRRNEQNAADAAALAGAGMAGQDMENLHVMYDNFSCGTSDVVHAMNVGQSIAINRAATNNFTIDNDITDKNGVQITCHVVDIGPYIDMYLDVSVMITAPTNTSFAQLFYSGEVKNTVISTARVHPRTNLGYGYAVAAMGTNCSTGGIYGNGNTTIHSDHAGVFSNSCFDFTNGGTHVYVNDPGGSGCRYYSGTVNPNWCDVPIVQSPIQLVPYVIPEPECSSLPTFAAINGSGNYTINPGNYPGITMKGSGKLTMNPGLYCLTGDVSLGSNTTTVGDGITMYFKNNAGYSTGASATLTLRAPVSDAPPAIRGLLMYAAPGNTGTFELYGGATSNYRGTVYIPDGSIDAHGGGGANAFESQFVGKMVTLEGTSDIYIDFEGAMNFQIPAMVDLQK